MKKSDSGLYVPSKPVILPEDLPEELFDLEQIRAEIAKRNLHDFMKQAWHIVEPGQPFLDNWHIGAISEHLMAVTRGEIRNLVINMPPRCMKSLCVAVFWPVWEWLNDPTKRWLFASYAQNLSFRDSRKCRQIIESEWFRMRYGHIFHLTSDQNQKGMFENNHRGYRFATSIEAQVTGQGGDRVIVDDPHNARHAGSDLKREAVLEWWDQAMSTRLNNPKTGAKVIVMQRLHAKDLSGHVLERGGYEHLILPMEYEVGEKKIITSIGWSDPRNEVGELLWPERITPVEVEGFKREMGTYGYVGQMQQRPTPQGGGLFRNDWFRYFKVVGDPMSDGHFVLNRVDPDGHMTEEIIQAAACMRFSVVDLAVSQRQTADYTVVTTCFMTPKRDALIMDVIRARFEGPDQAKLIQSVRGKWNPGFVAVEQSGYQLSLVQDLLRQGAPIRAITPDKDKVSRAIPASARYEAGTVFHLQGARWLSDLEYELMLFPKGEHDDIVDTISYIIYYVSLMAEPNIRVL